MTKLSIRPAETAQDLDAVRVLCWAYRSYLLTELPQDRHVTEAFYAEAYYQELMDRLPQEHAAPNGAMMVATLGGDVVGCGMTHRLAPGICEVKRVFVNASARGHGAGRALCLALMDQARSDGYHTMRLDTSKALTAARALYTELGFVERGPYYEVPEIAHGALVFYEMAL